jgi:hypothetical protein
MIDDDYDYGDDDDDDDYYYFTHRLFETVKRSSLQCRLHLCFNSQAAHSEL